MQVSDLLGLMANLSVGLDNTTPTERTIFLQYLNLAHFELYQETANFNQDLILQENLANLENTNTVTLSQIPYVMNAVYDVTHKQTLNRISRADLVAQDPALAATGTPEKYFIQKDSLQFYPTQTAVTQVSVWYTPQPSLLTENTDESEIPYPPAYHPVLVDGGLYYLFQQEGGFKNTTKENEALIRWQIGKTRLLSYLYTSSGEFLPTFSSV
jgi:hypothetical protein